ncbi:MAG: 2OG-Fe(II) oxygenase [Myxococcota bacterium]
MIEVQQATPGTVDPDTLPRLSSGELDVMVIRGAFPQTQMNALIASIQENRLGLRLRPQESPSLGAAQVSVLGVPVSPSDMAPTGPDPGEYESQREAVRAALQSAGQGTLIDGMGWLLTLAGGRAAQLAPGYAPCTLRSVPSGRGMGPHCENLYHQIAVYAGLRAGTAILDQGSFFVVIDAGEAGGALRLYDHRWSPGAQNILSNPGPFVEVSAQAGDMVLLAAGRRFHSVSPVEGPRPRWTIGGFWAPTKDHQATWFWG